MGSKIEINDTLLLSAAQGFPVELLQVELHQQQPITLDKLEGQEFNFVKSEVRILHKDPVRQFLVQKTKGKWLFWGHALIQSQAIEKKLDHQGDWDGNSWLTKGTFIISKLYDPTYQQLATFHEAPAGLSYFEKIT